MGEDGDYVPNAALSPSDLFFITMGILMRAILMFH